MTVITAKHSLIQDRVFVLASGEDEAAAAAAALGDLGVRVDRRSGIDELCRGIREGGSAAVVAAECLAGENAELLARTLAEQPSWSDFPLIILAPPGPARADGGNDQTPDGEEGLRAHEALGSPCAAVVLPRPVARATLVSAVGMALRARLRQYQLRDQLAERERHERALRESKERYRQLVESSPDAIFAASVDGRIVYANSAVVGLFGATDLGEVIGSSFLERVGEEDLARVQRRLRRGTRSLRRETPLECRWVRPGGAGGLVELTMSPLAWEGAAAVLVVVRDISARRAAEERQRFVAELSDLLRDLEGPEEIMEAAAGATVAYLGVGRAVFADIEEEGRLARRAWGSGEAARPDAGATFRMEDLRADARGELAAGRPLVVEDAQRDERMGGAAAPGLAAIQLRAGVCAPVIVHGRLVAFFLVHQREARAWSGDEVQLVEEVGRRTWLAVDRARAIARLRESEGSLRALTESLPQLVWTARPDGTLDSFNRKWEEYTGLNAAHADELDWLPLLHEEDREPTLRRWAQAVREGTPYELEHRVRRADGAFRWHLTRAYPLRDGDGRVVRWFGTGTDIDDRKRIEAELQRSEEEYRTTFELAAVGKSHADPLTGRLQRVNRKLCEITGYTEAELLGMRFLDITHPDDRQHNWEDYGRLLRGEIPELSIEKRYVRKDGGVIWVDVNSAIIRDREGRPLRCVAVIQDTTARRRAEEALRHSEQHLRDVLDSLEASVGVLTPEGVILEVNRDTLEATGMTAEDVVGRRLDEMPWFGGSPGTREEVRSAIARAAAGESVRFDVEVRARRGRAFIVDLTIAPMFGPDGAVTHLIPSAIDITGRKDAEAALRESEGRYRELADALPQLVWTCDAQGRMDYVNLQYQRYTGLDEAAIRGEGWMDLLHPDDLPRTRAAWEDAVSDRAPYDVEYRLRGADGSYRWFQVRAVPIRDDAGRIVRWFGACTDIHERREAAEALRRSEERLRLVFKATNDAVWDWSLADGRIDWNDAFKTLFGHGDGAKENTIEWWTEQVHPDDRERVSARLEAAIDAGAEHWSDEYRFRRADGGYSHVLDRGYLVRDASGEPVRMIGAMQDVTARREAEEALRASGNRFRQLADSMPQIVWSASPDGRLDYCNQRWYEFTGGPPCEEGDDPWAPVLHPEDTELHGAAWRESVRTGRPMQVEYRVLEHPTGQYRWHLGRMVPVLDTSGRVARWYGSSTDIDDQKNAQQRLSELVDELNRSNRELEDFAHIASHDLKEPLRGIRNYSSFLMEDYGEILDTEGQRKLRTIDRLGKRMDDLISSLLYYSQVGRTELAIENSDLNQVVLEVLESLGPLLGDRGVDVRLPRPLPTVRCDRVRVAEVYRNLITNAIKYNNKPDPWVEVSWRPPTSEPEREGAWPVLYVRDNGIGIPPRHYGTVFGIFKRLHGRDEYGGGTGSGLAFVKRIIERHRGRVWIESAEGEGTTFCFTLGREEHAAAQTAHPHR